MNNNNNNNNNYYVFNGKLSNGDDFNGQFELYTDNRVLGVIRNIPNSKNSRIYNDALLGFFSKKNLEFIRIPNPSRKDVPLMFFSYYLNEELSSKQNIINIGKSQEFSINFKNSLKSFLGNEFSNKILEAYLLKISPTHLPLSNNSRFSLDINLQTILSPDIQVLEQIPKKNLIETINAVKKSYPNLIAQTQLIFV